VQVFAYPKALGLAAIILFILGTIGMPRVPMYMLAALFAFMYFVSRGAVSEEAEEETSEDFEEAEQIRKPENVMELLQIEKMELELGYGLIPLVDSEQGGDLLDRIVMIRRQCAVELGFVVPPIRIRDNMQLKPNMYIIKVKGADVANSELLLDNYLAIGPNIENDTDLVGINTVEPAFNLPARWIDTSQKEQAEISGYTVVDPPSVLATHLTAVIKNHAFELLGRQDIQSILDFIRESNPAVVDELIPDLMSIGELQRVLSNLLKEQVSIRDMVTIMEILADYARMTRDVDVLTEYVRQGLKRQITRQYSGEENRIRVITLDPAIEESLRDSVQQSDFGSYLAVEPEFAQHMMEKITLVSEDLIRRGITPVLLCAPILRIYLKRLIDRFMSDLVVLSYNEIEQNIEVEVVGMVAV
jgi:flagellar biosynthesis protein FlhA